MKVQYPIFDHLSKFMVSLLHEETSETEKKYFVKCHAPRLKDGIFAFKNINFKILMYIQIFILVKAAFSLEGIQRSRLIMKNEQRKQARYFDKTNEKSSNYWKYLMDCVISYKKLCVKVRIDINASLPP